jgi:hypothetical protein
MFAYVLDNTDRGKCGVFSKAVDGASTLLQK